jgi:hypothetical protein
MHTAEFEVVEHRVSVGPRRPGGKAAARNFKYR